jgi:PAS domain S-box-containing protein/diguanylate cyclase (GGDEF)-like protein
MNVNEVPVSPEQYKEIQNIQHKIFEMVAQRAASSDILDELCLLAETLLPNSVASVMLKDKQDGLMHMIHSPSIPPEGVARFRKLKPGPRSGSCGAAVYKNESQFVLNAFTDDRWTDLREVAYDFNICACWSTPIRDENKEAIGTFALSSFEHREPSVFHKMLLETAANIVSIVIKNAFNEKRVKIFTQSMDNAKEGVIITDADNNIIEINKSFRDIYGYAEEDVLGKNPRILSSGLHNEDFYKKMWEDILTKEHWAGEITNILSNDKYITQWMSISSIMNEDGTKNYLAIFSDLTELKKAQQEANYLAYHDQLTKLENKSKLVVTLSNNDSNYSLIHLDINNFNYINIAYGFAFGDKLLKKISATLLEKFYTAEVFRINSDEFALLYREKVDLKKIIEEIQKYFYDNSFNIDKVQLNISLNYGACKGGANILENAALSLKMSKELGKNRYHIFDLKTDILKKDDRNKFIIANRLILDALDKDMIVPYFQAIRDNRTGKTDKFEALVRIKTPQRIVLPSEFLDSAKLSGLLPEITKVMIEKSFQIMQHRKESFSLNITEDDLSRKYLVDYFTRKMQEYHIAPSRVTLEILEGISLSGKKSHVSQLNKLKEIGFLLAIDDFGAEYSNFERILDLEIDFLKIDAKYIKNIDSNKKSYEIVKSIANFAKNSDILCVAEYVHSKEIQEIVEALDIEYSQGFYFSEPMSM